MKETSNHKLRWPEPKDSDTLSAYWQHLAEDTERELDAIAAKQIVGGSKGKLLIAGSTGAGAYKAMTGDGTIDENGNFQLGEGVVDISNLAATLAQTLVPAGTVVATARSTAATGFLLCEGQAVSRTTNKGLFEAIGTNYGAGDGSTTFNLPDCRGRSLVGKGTHADVNALTDSDGLSVGSRTPKHKHTGSSLIIGGPDGAVTVNAGSLLGVATNAHGHPVGGETGSDGAAYAVVNYMIKT